MPPTSRQVQLELRLTCLIIGNRLQEADALYPKVIAGPLMSQKLALYGVERAIHSDAPERAADLLIELANRQSPALAELPTPLFRHIGSQLTAKGMGARRDDLSLALARILWQPADGTDVRDSLASGAIRALVRDGRAGEAEPFVEQLESPVELSRFAAIRRYQPLWPAVEARLGKGSGDAIDRYAGTRLEAFARQPQIPSIRLDAVDAFLLLNRPVEAAETATPALAGQGRDYDVLQTVLLGAEARQLTAGAAAAAAWLQDFMGRQQAAGGAEGSTALLALGLALNNAGRHQDALNLVRQTIASKKDAFSGWGLAELHLEEVCALANLGRKDEAAAIAGQLADAGLEGAPSAIEAQLCLGNTARAAALLRAALATDDGALLLADDLQPAGARLAPASGRRADLWLAFIATPEARAAMQDRVRQRPRSLWPTREPRAIPRGPAAFPTS